MSAAIASTDKAVYRETIMNRELLFYAIWECDSTEGTEGSRFRLYIDKSSFSMLSHEEKDNFLGMKVYSQREVEKIRTESSELKEVKASMSGWIIYGLEGLNPLVIVDSDQPYPHSSDQLAPFFEKSVENQIIHMCTSKILSPVTARVRRVGSLTAFCEPVFSFEVKPFASKNGNQRLIE